MTNQKFSLTYLLLGILFITCIQCHDDSVNLSRCHLNPDAGMCEAAIPKYYYDRVSKKCTKFYWGGCGGVVPFDTMEECLNCNCQ